MAVTVVRNEPALPSVAQVVEVVDEIRFKEAVLNLVDGIACQLKLVSERALADQLRIANNSALQAPDYYVPNKGTGSKPHVVKGAKSVQTIKDKAVRVQSITSLAVEWNMDGRLQHIPSGITLTCASMIDELGLRDRKNIRVRHKGVFPLLTRSKSIGGLSATFKEDEFEISSRDDMPPQKFNYIDRDPDGRLVISRHRNAVVTALEKLKRFSHS